MAILYCRQLREATSEAQVAFLEAHPTASYLEVKNMQLYVPPVPAIEEYRAQKTAQLSALSLQRYNELCPDYKLKNALTGVYDEILSEEILTEYRRISEALRNEFYRVSGLINTAGSTSEVDACFAENQFNTIE
jgi:hypothetical protein